MHLCMQENMRLHVYVNVLDVYICVRLFVCTLMYVTGLARINHLST